MAYSSLMMSSEFRAKMDSFLVGLNAMVVKDYKAKYENLEPGVAYPEEGLRYVRVVMERDDGSKYSHCFLDKSNGDVLKCEGWKKPAKHARGNLFSATNGLEGVGVHGANCLK